MPAFNVIISFMVIIFVLLIGGKFLLPFLNQNVDKPQVSNSSYNSHYPGQESHRREQRLREAMQKMGNLRHEDDIPMSQYAFEQTSDEYCREQVVHDTANHTEYIGKGYCSADERLQIMKLTQVHLRMNFGNVPYIGSGSIVDPRHIIHPMGRYGKLGYFKPNYLWILTAAHCVFDFKNRVKCDYGEVRVPDPDFWMSQKPWRPVKPNVLDDGRFYEPSKFSDADVFVYCRAKSHGTDFALLRVSLPSKFEYGSYTIGNKNGRPREGSMKFKSHYNYCKQDDAFYGPYDDSDSYTRKKKQNGFKTDVFVFGYPGDQDKKAICYLSCPSELQTSEKISRLFRGFSMKSCDKEVKIPYGPSTKFWPVEFIDGHGEIKYTNQTSSGMSGGGVFLIDQDEFIHPEEGNIIYKWQKEPEFMRAAHLKAVHRGECEVGPRHARVRYNRACLITQKVFNWMEDVILDYDKNAQGSMKVQYY